MSDVLASLPASDRRTLARLAEAAQVEVEALIPALLSGYLRLMRDAPAALPRDPLAPLRAKGAA